MENIFIKFFTIATPRRIACKSISAFRQPYYIKIRTILQLIATFPARELTSCTTFEHIIIFYLRKSTNELIYLSM
ncbi:MAG: hypothetical protein DWQ10_05765 [Calditrichaeota bacterium]|nr:MAG: hypothetical protein DWQ10_05765 [Calditrichota bacterium]